MPELSNIQTYERLIGVDYKPTLEKFAKVLREIGLWNDDVRKAFDSFEWRPEDDGLVYSSITEIGHHKTKLSAIKVRPLLMAYTPAIDTFKDNWISCDLLIETEELIDSRTGNYYEYAYPFVKKMVIEMAKEFDQTGVYFTDEAQDGQDFDGIRTNDSRKLWQFDYAMIPERLKSLYKLPPITHKIKEIDNGLEVWSSDRWNEK